MAEYLIVSDSVAPVASSEVAVAAAGLARALVAAKHRVTILSMGAPDLVGRLPGMARRLRTIAASAGGERLDLPLFEGRAAHVQAALYVVGAESQNRGYTSAVLGSAAASLVRDGIVKPQVVLGWGETSASALSSVAAPLRLFALPTGRPEPALNREERTALGADDDLAAGSLLVLGVVGAHAVVVPCPTCIRLLEQHPALAARASDEPIVALRFGADEPPYDPATDPALPATYSADDLAGKAECRRALARRAGLALGPRTLVLAVRPLTATLAGRSTLDALPRLAKLDVAMVVPAVGDPVLIEKARILAIEHPGKVVVLGEAGEIDRPLLAGSDALLLSEADDFTGRVPGAAQRYGVLPLAPEGAATADHLVDYDQNSATGSALLYAGPDPFEIEGAVRRATALRANADVWQSVVRSVLAAAPRWSTTVALIDALDVGEAIVPGTDPVAAVLG